MMIVIGVRAVRAGEGFRLRRGGAGGAAGGGRGGEPRLVGAPAGRGDDEVDVAIGGQVAGVLGAEADLHPEHLEDGGARAQRRCVGAAHDEHACAALHGLGGDRVAGDAEAGDEDPQPGDVHPRPGAVLGGARRGRVRGGGHEVILGRASR